MLRSMWAERIPAAIEKAEKLTKGKDFKGFVVLNHYEDGVGSTEYVALPKTEVALAKALWNWEDNYAFIREDIKVPEEQGQPDPALRSFVEKVEAL